MGPRRSNLSVCIIAKDEAARLPAAIGSVKRIADEIIVVDTGSTDDTPAVASSLGARVVRHEWRNDFSEARNASIEAAAGDWILCLDADEYVPPESETNILQATAGSADAYFVRIESAVDSSAGRLFVHFFPRLFRKLPEVRFEGRVHEQLIPSLERAEARVLASDITIKHTGYAVSREELKTKARRNADLLLKDLEANPTDALALFHLGEAYSMLDDFEEAGRRYAQALKSPGLPREVKAVVLQNLASSLIKLRRYDEALSSLRKAQEMLPGLLTVHLLVASAQYAQGKFDKAEKEIYAYLTRSQQAKGKIGMNLTHEPDLPAAMVLLGKCKLAKGETAAARDVLKDAVRLDGTVVDAHILLARIAFEQMGFGESAEAYEEALKCNPRDERLYIELAKAYLAGGSVERAVEAVERAVKLGVRASAIFSCLGFLKIKQKDFHAAAEAYSQALNLNPGDKDACRKLAGIYRLIGDDESARAFARVSETMQ